MPMPAADSPLGAGARGPALAPDGPPVAVAEGLEPVGRLVEGDQGAPPQASRARARVRVVRDERMRIRRAKPILRDCLPRGRGSVKKKLKEARQRELVRIFHEEALPRKFVPPKISREELMISPYTGRIVVTAQWGRGCILQAFYGQHWRRASKIALWVEHHSFRFVRKSSGVYDFAMLAFGNILEYNRGQYLQHRRFCCAPRHVAGGLEHPATKQTCEICDERQGARCRDCYMAICPSCKANGHRCQCAYQEPQDRHSGREEID
jgi:hypothetical protein